MTLDSQIGALSALAAAEPGLALLVVFGSRARGDGRPDSDWDLGYLADPEFDPDAFLAQLVPTLGVDRIDLVDLRRASGQLRYRAAADAVVAYARDETTFQQFWLDAVAFWCDAAAVLRPAYAAVLDRLTP